MIVIVDASVAAMWFVPEQHSDRAALLLDPEYQLVAPDLIRLEVGSALLKAIRRNEVTLEDGEEALGTLLPTAVRMLRSEDHFETAFDIAHRLGGSIYDAIYIALARTLDAPIATNDVDMAATARKAEVQASLIAAGVPALPHPSA